MDVTSATNSGYKYILAYGIMFMMLFFASKTKVGYTAIYYLLVLSIVILLVTQYQFIAQAMQPLTANSNESIKSLNITTKK